MTICSACGCEVHDDCRRIEYSGEDFYYCEDCDSDECIVTDSNGVAAPRDHAIISMLYDGDSSRYQSGMRTIILQCRNDDDDGFACGICGGRFYGSGAYDDDQGEIACVHCAEQNWFYYGHGWHVDPMEDEYELQPSSESFIGEPTDRFLGDYTIGFEFEHAPVKRSGGYHMDSLYDCIVRESEFGSAFEQHGDGSIAALNGYGSCEIVTKPASGAIVERLVTEFYGPFRDGAFIPGPEHPTCGFHMHVGSRVLRKFINGESYHCMPADVQAAATRTLRYIWAIVKEFVSSSRRKNYYCSGSPQMRDKNTHYSGGASMAFLYGCSSYPAIAVRSLGTIEFRIWPSSNSIRYTMARAELSQKMVAFYDACLLDDQGNWRLDAERVASLMEVASACKVIRRTEVPRMLANLLGLSEETLKTLEILSSKFNPFSSKRTTFKFTDLQILSIQDEDSMAHEDVVEPSGDGEKEYSDTTIGIKDESASVYFSFGEGLKCYSHSDKANDLVKQLASGGMY